MPDAIDNDVKAILPSIDGFDSAGKSNVEWQSPFAQHNCLFPVETAQDYFVTIVPKATSGEETGHINR